MVPLRLVLLLVLLLLAVGPTLAWVCYNCEQDGTLQNETCSNQRFSPPTVTCRNPDTVGCVVQRRVFENITGQENLNQWIRRCHDNPTERNITSGCVDTFGREGEIRHIKTCFCASRDRCNDATLLTYRHVVGDSPPSGAGPGDGQCAGFWIWIVVAAILFSVIN